jgi:hypothetical protein
VRSVTSAITQNTHAQTTRTDVKMTLNAAVDAFKPFFNQLIWSGLAHTKSMRHMHTQTPITHLINMPIAGSRSPRQSSIKNSTQPHRSARYSTALSSSIALDASAELLVCPKNAGNPS